MPLKFRAGPQTWLLAMWGLVSEPALWMPSHTPTTTLSRASMAMTFPYVSTSLFSIKTCSLWLWYVVHHVCVSLTHVDLICLEFMDSGPLKHLLMPFSEMRKFSYFLACLSSSGQGSTSESHRLGEPFHHWATPHPHPHPQLSFPQMFLSADAISPSFGS